MATKTISLDLEAYACLERARQSPRESFSRVIKRATWAPPASTAASLLESLECTEPVMDSVIEYLEGFKEPGSTAALALIGGLRSLPVDAQVAMEYAVEARRLRSAGQLIGANDLWIACTAKCHGLPIITRNAEEFSRVAGLSVISY